MPYYLQQTILLFALFISSSMAFAHQGSIGGKITDGKTGKPLEGASIYLTQNNRSGLVDAFGQYFIHDLSPGTYTITVNALGYKRITTSVSIEGGATTHHDFAMQKGQVTLKDITVNAERMTNHSAVSLIDLALRPINTAQDMMRLVPGVFLSQHQGGGKAEQMFVRGFDVDHGTDVRVSVDEVPVNLTSHAHGQGYADLHFLIPELIDKMEFGKGPYAIEQGNLATAAWVTFKTKNYLDKSFIKLEGGTYGYARVATAIDLLGNYGKARNESAYLAGEYGYNRSYFDKPQDFNRINLTGKYTKRIGDKKIFSATLSGFRSFWSASGQIPERAVAQGIIDRFGELDHEAGNTSRYQINLQYTQSLRNNATFKTNLYAGNYDFSLYSDFTFFLNDPINGDEIHQAESRFFIGYNASYTHRHKFGKLEAKTELGIGIRKDNTDNSELSQTVNRLLLNNIRLGDIRETNAFAYAQESVHLLPQLIATLGTRYDYFIQRYNNKIPTALELPKASYNNGAFSPKAGLYYNFRKAGRLYINYGVGFHSNDARDIYFRPESGSQVLPLEHAIDIGLVIKPTPTLLLQAAVFNMTLQQEYTYSGDAGEVPELSGKTRRMGVDFSGRYAPLKWIYLDVDFNYTHARFVDEPEGENFVELAPSFTSVGGLTVKPFNDFSTGLRYRLMADRPANKDNSIVAPGYNVIDFTANYARPRYEFGLQIQNLTNTKWNEAAFATETQLRGENSPVDELCFTPGTPFFIKLSATYKF